MATSGSWRVFRKMCSVPQITYGQYRCLLTPPSQEPSKVIQTLYKHVVGASKNFDPKFYDWWQEKLLEILPTDQSQLPARRMLDSFDSAIIPVASDPEFREKYLGSSGNIRVGRLLEDMDIFSVHLVYKHVLNPLRPADMFVSPWKIVTGLVDQIDFTGVLRPDCDIRISGHVTWVGQSSAETTLHLEQAFDGSWVKITAAKFVLIAREPLNGGATFINPLKLVTEEEKMLFEQGEMNKIQRQNVSQDADFKTMPDTEEQKVVHHHFLERRIQRLVRPVRKENTVWMQDAKFKNLIVCQPEHRNIFGYIFGGFIMRQAYELAWANAFTFSKARPICTNMGKILFRAPVAIGSLLYFNSQISYTQTCRPDETRYERNRDHDYHFVQTMVTAEVVDPNTGDLTMTNVFNFTFMIEDKEPPSVIPFSYHDAMVYLNGRRLFKATTGL